MALKPLLFFLFFFLKKNPQILRCTCIIFKLGSFPKTEYNLSSNGREEGEGQKS